MRKTMQQLYSCAHSLKILAIGGVVSVSISCGGGKPEIKQEASAKSPPQEQAASSPENDLAGISAKLAKLLPFPQSGVLLDTPDNSVKSWWNIYDYIEKLRFDKCKVNENSMREWMQINTQALLTSEAIARFALSTGCEIETWKRQIDEVKSESETRAVVFASVWRTSAVPASADKDEIEKSKKGTKMKYVLEKSQGKWLLTDVYRFSPKTSYSTENWDRLYDGEKKNFFIGTVYYQ